MLDREAAEALFLKHLDLIDKIARMACISVGVRDADVEDFIAQVRMKLVEDDYGVVRRFERNAEFKTYLTSVVSRYVVNYVRELRGRWRPSAAAERAGPEAVELERLVRREGYTLQEAGEKLRTAGRTTLSDAQLARILGQFPVRGPLRPEVPEPATGMDAPGESRADERVIDAEAGGRRAEIFAVLKQALEQLQPEEQVIVRLHLLEGHTLADVARTLRLEQKPLYRRAPRLLARLLELLERAGLHQDDVRALLHTDDES